MNYTEEEFFGNIQNANKDNKSQKEKRTDYTTTVLSTFLKTLLMIFVSLFYICATVFTLSPEKAIKIYNFLGAEKSVLACYERIYKKSGALDDLYNLIQKSIEAEEFSKTSKYISELQNKRGYLEFCLEVNNATCAAVESKYIAFVGDLDGYLVSQNILALYNKGEKQLAKEKALEDLFNDNIYSFGMSTYIDCLCKDKQLTEDERKQLIIELYESKFNEEDISYYVNNRLDNVNYNNSENKTDKILRVYTALKIQNTKLVILKSYTPEDEVAISDLKSEISELQNVYDEAISK